MASKATPRGTAALALVGLLVLVAQPAAVLDAPAPATSQAPETGEAGCEVLDGIQDERLVDAELLDEVPDVEVCLDQDASLTEATLDEGLGELVLK